jgi:hypothetical protein
LIGTGRSAPTGSSARSPNTLTWRPGPSGRA